MITLLAHIHNLKNTTTRTKTSRLAKLLAIGSLDQRNLVLAAKRNNKLFVRLVQDAYVCLATVEGLGGLAQAASESVIDQRMRASLRTPFSASRKDGHLALETGGMHRQTSTSTRRPR